jgi:ABC-2 type transport system ATP-binding protein
MAQKVQFIAAVIAHPKLLILDEPFSGLDPVNLEVIKRAVLGLRERGTTILFSTHDMEVAEKMCDSICMIYRGKKVIDGTLETIQDSYGRDVVRLRLEESSGIVPTLTQLPDVQHVNDFGRMQELRLAKNADTQRLLAELMNLGTVRHFELSRPSLRDIFVRIAGPVAEEDGHA